MYLYISHFNIAKIVDKVNECEEWRVFSLTQKKLVKYATEGFADDRQNIRYRFIKSLEMTGKVHEVHIAFKVQFQYNKEDIR